MPVLAEPSYSESSFAFAVTYSLVSGWWDDLAGIPYFPWIDEEGLLGWDVSVPFWGLSLFLQFKRAQAFQYRGSLGPCFRFKVYKPSRSNQHNQLRAWATTEPSTFYCAPNFTSGQELTDCYLSRTLLQRSIAIPVASLPSIRTSDHRQHFVTYTGLGPGSFRSRGQPFEGIVSLQDITAERLRDARATSIGNWQRFDDDYLDKIEARIDELEGEQTVARARPASSETRALPRLATLRARLRGQLGLEWLVLPHSRSNRPLNAAV